MKQFLVLFLMLIISTSAFALEKCYYAVHVQCNAKNSTHRIEFQFLGRMYQDSCDSSAVQVSGANFVNSFWAHEIGMYCLSSDIGLAESYGQYDHTSYTETLKTLILQNAECEKASYTDKCFMYDYNTTINLENY